MSVFYCKRKQRRAHEENLFMLKYNVKINNMSTNKKWGTGKKTNKQLVFSESGPPIKLNRIESERIVCYTDGSTLNNGQIPNRGSYAFIVVEKNKILYEYSRAITNTTNNRCEMQAITDCIMYLEENLPGIAVTIYSDSQYCIRGINEWSKSWIKKGFSGIANADEWRQLKTVVDRNPHLTFCWIKGHSTSIYNNHCDRLCQEAYGKTVKEPEKAKKAAKQPIPDAKTFLLQEWFKVTPQDERELWYETNSDMQKVVTIMQKYREL